MSPPPPPPPRPPPPPDGRPPPAPPPPSPPPRPPASPPLARAAQAARQFFACPLDAKRIVSANANHRGFHARGDALMYGAKRPDEKEFYSIGLELGADDPSVLAGEKLRGPNNWPSFMPELQPALYDYFTELGGCGADLLRVIALSLRRDQKFFAAQYNQPPQR